SHHHLSDCAATRAHVCGCSLQLGAGIRETTRAAQGAEALACLREARYHRSMGGTCPQSSAADLAGGWTQAGAQRTSGKFLAALRSFRFHLKNLAFLPGWRSAARPDSSAKGKIEVQKW